MGEPPAVEGVRHRWVEARGLRFHLAEAGEGDKVVLCLHGWPQHWYEWRFLLPKLAAAGYRAIAMDLRGFGWSDAPRDGYEKENLASDVLAVLDAEGLDQVRLVGHDWGGWIGYLLCLRAPERFSQYLALNILTPWTEPRMIVPEIWRFTYQWVIATPGLGYRLHTSGTLVPKVLLGAAAGPRELRRRDPAHLQRQPRRARPGPRLRADVPDLPSARAARDHRRPLRPRALTVPTLQLHGTDDAALRPKMLAGWQRHVDDMRLELVEGVGHFIADEAPDLVADRALSFFGASDRAPGAPRAP